MLLSFAKASRHWETGNALAKSNGSRTSSPGASADREHQHRQEQQQLIKRIVRANAKTTMVRGVADSFDEYITHAGAWCAGCGHGLRQAESATDAADDDIALDARFIAEIGLISQDVLMGQEAVDVTQQYPRTVELAPISQRQAVALLVEHSPTPASAYHSLVQHFQYVATPPRRAQASLSLNF